jgi:hypothetical protein
MTRSTRWLVGIVIGIVLLLAGTLGATAAAIYHAGKITVEIDEKDGGRLRLDLPAGLLTAAATVAPASLIEQTPDEVIRFVPALKAGWRELADASDFVLVDFRSTDESVRVEKIGGQLQILVEHEDGRIRVGLPIRALGAVLERLDG